MPLCRPCTQGAEVCMQKSCRQQLQTQIAKARSTAVLLNKTDVESRSSQQGPSWGCL